MDSLLHPLQFLGQELSLYDRVQYLDGVPIVVVDFSYCSLWKRMEGSKPLLWLSLSLVLHLCSWIHLLIWQCRSIILPIMSWVFLFLHRLFPSLLDRLELFLSHCCCIAFGRIQIFWSWFEWATSTSLIAVLGDGSNNGRLLDGRRDFKVESWSGEVGRRPLWGCFLGDTS